IGKYVSAGCIRLKNSDILWLFEQVPIGTRVEIINLPPPVENTVPIANYTVFVDEKIVFLEAGQRPYIHDKLCFIPLRPLMEAMGYKVSWVIEDNRADISIGGSKVSVWPASDIIRVDNYSVRLAACPVLREEGGLYVPTEFFSLVLGGSASQDSKDDIKISSPSKQLADRGFIYCPPPR
ncbi:MAG: L,D-transpeptidase family protein, partial [Desulfocucumaceae bacterium]